MSPYDKKHLEKILAIAEFTRRDAQRIIDDELPFDSRQLAIAATSLEQSFLWLRESVMTQEED